MDNYDNLPKKKKRAKRWVNPNIVLLAIAILAATAVLLFKHFGPLSPSDVTFLWNAALYDGDIELAEQYTSETSFDYIASRFGSLTALSERYDDDNRGTSQLVEERFNGDVAVVVYLTCYADGTLKEWEDTLFLENGTWKLAPQYVLVRRVTGTTCE